MKLHKVREEIYKNTGALFDGKFELNTTWIDTQTFSFAGPMQPISRIIEHKLRLECKGK